MTTVFLAGSIKIRSLDAAFVERVGNVISEDFHVVVGDANGADTAIQEILFENGAEKVIVYCSGRRVRNNIGNWPVKNIFSSATAGTREFFTAKDQAMATVAHYGLFVWDMVSTGTLSNILELLRLDRKSVVYLGELRRFVTVKSIDDASNLVSLMSETAREQAERKIGLRSKISSAGSPIGFLV